MQDEAVRAHQPAAADNTAAASGEASLDAEADRRLFEELERTAAYLHRDGCGDGAARRPRSDPPPARHRAEMTPGPWGTRHAHVDHPGDRTTDTHDEEERTTGATKIAAPTERLQQQRDALARANDVRSRRAQLKRDLKASRRPIEEVLGNPPEYLASATILDLLIATPKRRRIKANKVLLRCRISPSRTIGALTERQRRVIVSELQHS